MATRVHDTNLAILRQCREQAGLTLSDVKSRVSTIEALESGSRLPTLNQLDTLSNLYSVPRWVFIADHIPEQYRFERAIPAFRQFSASQPQTFDHPKLRRIVARVERYRDLMIELIEDTEDAGVEPFAAPTTSDAHTPEETAEAVRRWLAPASIPMEFHQWRAALESKGVFVFLTSRYPGWSNIDDLDLRGLSIYHDELPVIVVNDSDSKRAQSFTLFHELAHILRKEHALDDWDAEFDTSTERSCDEFAGSFLMPEEQVRRAFSETIDLDLIKRSAGSFSVSAYALLVRLRQLQLIDFRLYERFRDRMFEEYERQRLQLRQSSGGPARDRPKEVLTQFGPTFTRLLLQAFNDREIGLQKASALLGLKRASQALEVQALL